MMPLGVPKDLENRIGYHFHNQALLKQALTHSFFSNEQKINKKPHYERLEFLGDAVLELVASDFLYHKYPQMAEGKLSKTRAAMVCEASLALCAEDLDLGNFLLLGKGEESDRGRIKASIIADVMEAIIGAIYLDGGMEPAKAHIYRFILSDLEHKTLFYDSKSNLQEYIQKHLKKEFHYELVGMSGPEHDKIFQVEVLMEGVRLGSGQGRTKKAAEQKAAYEALLGFKAAGKELNSCI